MNCDRIYLSSPHMSEEGYEKQYIEEAFDTNWIAPLGKNVDEFEKEMANKVHAKGCVALSSGTAAIHMALKAAGVGKGDKVLCSTFTFSASANPIIYLGAEPVFVDSDYKTWNMSIDALSQAIANYPDIKAAVIVHLYGLSADMDGILDILRNHNIIIIEDAAESLGTTYRGKQTGTIGDYGIYSFNGNKLITTSGGGMLTSNDTDTLLKVKFWATQSRDKERYYQHSELGYNYRMSNVLAGIGRGQLKVLDRRIEKKKYIFDTYKSELSAVLEISFMPINEWNEPNFWLSCITLNGAKKPLDIIMALEEHNIEARHLWKPMHKQPFFSGYNCLNNNVAEDLFNTGLCLPSDTKMTDNDLDRVISIIKSIIRN